MANSKKKKDKMYNVLKFDLGEIVESKFNLYDIDIEKHTLDEQYNLMFDQFKLMNGEEENSERRFMDEIVLVEAKNKESDDLKKILREGFKFNGNHYVRSGKSQSQAKDGITIFVKQKLFDEALERTQLGVKIKKAVISKYEAYRNLVYSSCTPIREEKLPYIVIVDEYTKIIENQPVEYATEETKTYFSKRKNKEVNKPERKILQGTTDVKLSPFDGFGVHTKEISLSWSKWLGLEDRPTPAFQIRLPYLKGMSVEAPIKEFYAEHGVTEIQDVYGNWHDVGKIDCIWNTSMFKGHSYFKKEFKFEEVWTEYIKRLYKYRYKVGISKYAHHTDNITKYTRLNFQFLQCLDLWNEKYIHHREHTEESFDILSPVNQGKIIELAQYTIDLWKKIYSGDLFYTLKFLGIEDSEGYLSNGKYEEAILINQRMIHDPAVSTAITSKLQKSIDDAKFGKIYSKGFYHLVVGDIIGFLQYAGGKEPIGCLKAGEFYCKSFEKDTTIASFRAPLVSPSEINVVKVVDNELTKKYLSHFKNYDLVMVNMYDLTMPQQGGADMDGDLFYLTDNELIINAKIDAHIVVDMEDKVAAMEEDYTAENIVNYELRSRDSNIGQITNISTSILNRYTESPKTLQQHHDDVSLLRLFQGKEIDKIKTGVSWEIPFELIERGKQLPYFMLYRYPNKMSIYQGILKRNQLNNEYIKKINKQIEENNRAFNENVPLETVDDLYVENIAFKSSSPMNELCDYIETWEKHTKQERKRSVDYSTKELVIDNKLMDQLTDKRVLDKIRHINNYFADKLQSIIDDYTFIGKLSDSEKKDKSTKIKRLFKQVQEDLMDIKLDGNKMNEELLANYLIHVSYSRKGENKLLCWSLYSKYILKNLRDNTPPEEQMSYKLNKVKDQKENTYEFLGEYYMFNQNKKKGN